MKIASRILLVTLLLSCGSVASIELAQSPIFGTWRVDTSKLPMPPDVRPKSVEITFQPVERNGMSTQVHVTTADGSIMASESVTDLAGTPAKVSGNLEADTVSTTMPLPQVLVMQLSLNGNPGSTRIYAVQSGGLTMTETAANYDARGLPYTRINYFHKKR
jgi:hypothetical protein